MLIAAALGSVVSRRLAGSDGRRWRAVFVGLLLSGLAMWLAYPFVRARLLSAAMPLRIAATAGLIGPVAFFMDMPFPLGLLELDARPRGAVAWAWSMNGLFTTTYSRPWRSRGCGRLNEMGVLAAVRPARHSPTSRLWRLNAAPDHVSGFFTSLFAMQGDADDCVLA